MNGRVLVVDVGTSSVRAAVVDGDARDHRRAPGPIAPRLARPRARRVRRRRDGGPRARARHPRARGRRPGRRRRYRQPARVDGRVGPGHRHARRPRTGLAGPADRRTLPRAERYGRARRRRTTRRRRPRRSSTSPTRIAAATCASAPSTRWIAWTLSEGALLVTDATNAQVTALRTTDNDALVERRARRAADPRRLAPVGRRLEWHRRRPRPCCRVRRRSPV